MRDHTRGALHDRILTDSHFFWLFGLAQGSRSRSSRARSRLAKRIGNASSLTRPDLSMSPNTWRRCTPTLEAMCAYARAIALYLLVAMPQSTTLFLRSTEGRK